MYLGKISQIINQPIQQPRNLLQIKNWMEQERIATIRNLQTQLSQIAPELEITPKKKDTH